MERGRADRTNGANKTNRRVGTLRFLGRLGTDGAGCIVEGLIGLIGLIGLMGLMGLMGV